MAETEDRPARVFPVETRFQRMARRAGGVPREQAIDNAQAKVEEIKPGFEDWLTAELTGLTDEIARAQAGTAEPEIEFSVRGIDTARGQAIWSSVSHGRGDDGVFFFDRGRVPTAHELASELARGLIEMLLSSAEKTS